MWNINQIGKISQNTQENYKRIKITWKRDRQEDPEDIKCNTRNPKGMREGHFLCSKTDLRLQTKWVYQVPSVTKRKQQCGQAFKNPENVVIYALEHTTDI